MYKYNKEKLPSPESVLNILGLKAIKRNQKGYLVLCCPFHKGGAEKNPSLNLHSSKGHYKCHSCGAKGGSIIDFYIKHTNTSFKEAAKDLGAWEESYE